MSRFVKLPPMLSVVTEPSSNHRFQWRGVFLTAVWFLIYSAAFSPLYSRIGLAAAIFSLFPVLVAGLWLGFGGGLLASLIAFLLNTFLFNLVGLSGWNTVINHNGMPGSIALFIIGGFVGFMSELNRRLSRQIADRKHTEKTLERRAHELQTLFQTSLEVNTQANLDSLLPAIVQRAASLIGVESGGLYLMQADGQSLRLVVNHNSPEQCIGYKLHLGEGIAGGVAKSGELLLVEDYREWNARLKVYDDTPLRRVLGVPLKVKDKVIGVITVADRTNTGSFSEDEIRLVSLFADQAALTIENTRLLEQERTRTRELATLYEAIKAISSDLALESVLRTVVKMMAQVSGSDGCTLSLLNRERDAIVTWVDYRSKNPDLTDAKGTTYSLSDFPATQGVVTTGQPLVINPKAQNADQAELAYMAKIEVTALLMLPLISHDQVTGLVELYEEDNEERIYTQEEIQLLQSLTAQAAIAIENARLFDDAQRHLKQTTALREIDQAISGSMQLRLVVQIVLKHIVSELGVDAAVVLLYDPNEGILKYELGSGFRTDALKHTRLRLGDGYAGRAALTRKTIYLPDLQNRTTDFLRSPIFHQESFVCYFGVPLIAKGEIKGVLEIFHRTPFKPDEEWLAFMEMLAGQVAIAIDNATLYKDLQRSNEELSLAYDATIEGWSRALDLRDKETEGHTQRVTELTMRMARKIGISEEKQIHIQRGALLHDIGKMGIPDRILLKPDKLTDEERDLMRRHPDFAYEMLKPIAYLEPALDIPYCHHEKWDGTGYPRGLKGEEIPLSARIFAVIDVYDALTSDRPYRPAWTKEKTLEYIREQAGMHFDPEIVKIFLETLGQEGYEE
jgi:putative nucleotidyltransferase with HDIG domain